MTPVVASRRRASGESPKKRAASSSVNVALILARQEWRHVACAKSARKKIALFSCPKYQAGKHRQKKGPYFAGKNLAPLASLQITIDQVRFRRASKKRTREKRTTKTVQNTCTTIVVLPSPRSLFFSIELG